MCMMYHIIDEALAGWWRLQAQEGGQPAVLLHNDAIHVQQPSNISALRGDGDGQGGQEDPGGHPEDSKQSLPSGLYCSATQVFISPQVICQIPLHLILGEIFAHFPGEVIEAVKGAGMEKSISRFPEHSRHLVVVVGHQLGFRRLLGKSKQAVDVFNSLKCFLEKKNKTIRH